ncbi:MAG TPA: GNAT family N-acetyltransferase [Burkholderiaceae bacterium]|nr:GNAT family N-acetyltransferase [Burkholderiaceae bacterium]
MTSSDLAVSRLSRATERDIAELADVLADCVDGGASVSFMHPLSAERARAFWRGVAQEADAGARALIVARLAGAIVGTVQLVLEQPENQPHRADLAKMLVHRRARRHGIGAALLRKAEDVARECGKTLLVLDTASPDAERLYARHGWIACGQVPDYALLPRGGLCATTFYYRRFDG